MHIRFVSCMALTTQACQCTCISCTIIILCFFQISPVVLDAFLCQLEKGYKTHNNFYHNETHGADVLQTVHALICSARLEEVRGFAAHALSVWKPCDLCFSLMSLQVWLSSLEVLALLLAAIIHDVDHPGTTNAFQVKTQ